MFNNVYTRFIWLILPVISLGLCLNFIYFNIKGVYYLTGPSLFVVTYGPFIISTLSVFLFLILAFFGRASQIGHDSVEDNYELSFFARVSFMAFKLLCNILSIESSYVTFRLLRLEKDRLDSINLFGDRFSFLSDYAIHRKWSFSELQDSLMVKLNQLNLPMSSEEKDFLIFQSQGSMKNLNILIEEWVQKLSAPLPPLSFRQKLVNDLTSYFSSGLNFIFDNPRTTITIAVFSSILLYSSWSYFFVPKSVVAAVLPRVETLEESLKLTTLTVKLNSEATVLVRDSLSQKIDDVILALQEVKGLTDSNSIFLGAMLDYFTDSDPNFKSSIESLLSEPSSDSSVAAAVSNQTTYVNLNNNNNNSN